MGNPYLPDELDWNTRIEARLKSIDIELYALSARSRSMPEILSGIALLLFVLDIFLSLVLWRHW